MDSNFLLMLTVWIICGIIGVSMSEKRNRNRFGGFALGFFLGLIGLAIIALVGEKKDQNNITIGA